MKLKYVARGDLTSVSQLLKEIDRYGSTQRLLYRGQANAAFELIPSISRQQRVAKLTCQLKDKDERDILYRFIRRGHDLFTRRMTAGEAFFVARHFGLPTRLLDWSASPLIALFFCCIHDPDNDGTLWALRRRRSLAWRFEDLHDAPTVDALFDLLDEPGPYLRFVDPVYNNDRIRAQEGCFTIHSDHRTPLDQLSTLNFRSDNLEADWLGRWTVASSEKGKLLLQLSRLGISSRSVYPDLEGIARSIVEAEVLWRS